VRDVRTDGVLADDDGAAAVPPEVEATPAASSLPPLDACADFCSSARAFCCD